MHLTSCWLQCLAVIPQRVLWVPEQDAGELSVVPKCSTVINHQDSSSYGKFVAGKLEHAAKRLQCSMSCSTEQRDEFSRGWSGGQGYTVVISAGTNRCCFSAHLWMLLQRISVDNIHIQHVELTRIFILHPFT